MSNTSDASQLADGILLSQLANMNASSLRSRTPTPIRNAMALNARDTDGTTDNEPAGEQETEICMLCGEEETDLATTHDLVKFGSMYLMATTCRYCYSDIPGVTEASIRRDSSILWRLRFAVAWWFLFSRCSTRRQGRPLFRRATPSTFRATAIPGSAASPRWRR